jgi:parallel beta-helix repeat protein
VASENNTEGFNGAPVSGGMKFTSARTITVRNNEANSNGKGSGIWFDVSCYNMTLVNNTANANLKYGLEAEISGKGIIANNITWNNKEAGIILFDANDFRVYNNDVGGGNWHGIKLAQDQRRQSDSKYLIGRDPRYLDRVDPEVTWLTKDIVISNNVFGNKGDFDRGIYQLYGLDGRSNWSMDNMKVTIDGNLFNKKTDASQPTMVAWGGNDNVSLTLYETPAALAAAKNAAWVNAQIPGSKRIEDMGPEKIAYQWVAKPLPGDIAAAIGKPTGSKQLGTKY